MAADRRTICSWPETVCPRLGLGDLIERMPAGLFQVVGETGWQLSHGERSRVYMARALLQGADLVVLDESFAELDPDSLQRCLPHAAELAEHAGRRARVTPEGGAAGRCVVECRPSDYSSEPT